jgi:LPXTG-motif cell wall-anchored protein
MTRAVRHLTTLAVVLLSTLSILSPTAQAASIIVSPTTVAPGGTVRLSGDILAPDGTPGCLLPATVTLISDAFVGLGEFAGVGAVRLPVDATAHFDATVTLSPTVAEGTYRIGGRCGGGNIGVSATLEIKNLPATGPAMAVWPTVAMAAGLAVGGLVLLIVRRRHRPIAT